MIEYPFYLPEEEAHPVAKALIKAGCLELGTHTLHSGETSPAYVSIGELRSHLAQQRYLAEICMELLFDENLRFDKLADIPTGPTTLTTTLANMIGMPQITPKDPGKNYGSTKPIIGHYEKGQTVGVVEGVVNKGDSLIAGLEVLERAGLNVVRIAVVVDREQGGIENLITAGYGDRVAVCVKLSQLLRVANDMGQVSDQELQTIFTQLKLG